MRTTTSIDEELLREADASARRMGLSRSGFFALAVNEFLKRERREQILTALNQVYAGVIPAADKRLLKGIKAKLAHAVEEHW